ncbi:calponin homology domain-containing protein DDB_G0272472 [Drosophila sulfurigaster albostrigata]|uniref:calponin homology domain-containing protein DDB_G0272472 n=1 Tax=Drosophila sulfurigaster albostrigata TaxID=89887 RepID=UPI002D21B914|nr:calponin homology domain-containing protein DDB_G0272472 [Drosophila sulfurigaster albostrigata]
MNFSDDPLADLLSDNSLDNDNFFDAPSTGKKLPKANRPKGKLEDLFGIKEESEADVQSPASAAATTKPNATSTPRIVKQKPSLSMDDADDDDLGFDPKRPKSGGGARKNLLDDLLVAAEPKRNIFDDIVSGSDATKRPSTGKPSMSRQSTDTTTDTSNVLSQARPKTAGGPGRRSSASAQSTNLNADPLGLFGREKETNATVSGMSTPVSKKRGTADWLGLGVDSQSAVEAEPERPATPHTPQQVKESTQPMEQAKSTADVLRLADTDAEEVELRPMADNTAQQILMLNNMHMESSHSYNALQQQETQLVIAAQMKSQERALLEMQRKQESQDRRFQTLLQQQLQRQLQMEEHIKAQQERINVHLQLLMTQPAMEDTNSNSNIVEAKQVASQKQPEPAKDETREQLLQLETDVKRNLLEKLRLEELVANMKVNYEQEIQMIESSYKKQLKVLEDHCEAVQERLKLENSELREYYTSKLDKLKADYELQLSTLKQDHEDDLRLLRSSHEADLERIRQAKLLEQAAVRDHGSYLETLRLASSDLQELREGLSTTKEREQQLESRERRLADAERRLKIDEESAEEEKRRLMELVSTLELQLSRLSKDSAEENWQLRQRMANLEAEKKAFEQEKLYHRDQMARDEKRIEELKSMQLAEMERLQLDNQQERTRLLVEQQKLEMQHKLHEQGDTEKERLELEAQLQVARDAIKQADEQRDRCHKQQRELEQRKRVLQDKENALNVKEDEVVQASSAYRLAINRSHMAENKAREAEQLLHAKLQLLGKRAHELSEKEAQMSQERMLLAQDRIALHKLKEQIGQSKCALCKMGVENVEFSQRMASHNRGKPSTDALPASSTTATVQQVPPLPARDIVDRMLDDNIDASYRRMYNLSSNADLEYWNAISGLDDDAKKLALNGNTLDVEDLMLANLNLN